MMTGGTLFSGIGAPEYRAIGNSMAVPCVGWVLAQVQQIAATATLEAAA